MLSNSEGERQSVGNGEGKRQSVGNSEAERQSGSKIVPPRGNHAEK